MKSSITAVYSPFKSYSFIQRERFGEQLIHKQLRGDNAQTLMHLTLDYLLHYLLCGQLY